MGTVNWNTLGNLYTIFRSQDGYSIEVHKDSYVQYSGPRMATILEYMRNPMYNFQFPGWVQGLSTWGILCTIFRSQDGYSTGVHEESYVQYSVPRMGTGLEYMRNPMYNIQVPGWVQYCSTWGILCTIFRSRVGTGYSIMEYMRNLMYNIQVPGRV